MLKKEGFDGSPMPKHARLPGLGWAHFERWLELFHCTTGELQVPALKDTVDAMARRMASTLWQNYQKHNPASAWLCSATGARSLWRGLALRLGSAGRRRRLVSPPPPRAR